MLRSTFLYLSEQQQIFNFVSKNGLARKFARRFVAGETLEEAKQWFEATRTALDTETGATGVVPVHHGRTTWPAG